MPDQPSSPWSTHAPPSAYGAPYAAQGGGPRPLEPYGAPPPTPVWPGPPIEVRVAAPAPAGRGLAITGVVLGGLALLGMLLVGLLVVAFAFVGAGEDEGGSCTYAPVRGTIAPVTGNALTGTALAAEVTSKITDDCGEPEGVACPATAKVAKDVTTVCHGTDYGEDSAFVVFFEDDLGSYTLLEI